MTVLVLMAGAGKRFSEEGYKVPKPMIPVDGRPMVVKATEELPRGGRYLFVTREGLLDRASEDAIRGRFASAEMIRLKELTEGQACSALAAEKFLDPEAPLLIGACDHSVLYERECFKKMAEGPKAPDALIFTYRRNPIVRFKPSLYGWVRTDGSTRAVKISVKVPLEGDPAGHHAIAGAFWFKKANFFIVNARQMIHEDSRVNGEFYIDQCMNYLIRAGLNVHVFEADRYASWGTPHELKTYEYWQEFFSRAWFHPYGKTAVRAKKAGV